MTQWTPKLRSRMPDRFQAIIDDVLVGEGYDSDSVDIYYVRPSDMPRYPANAGVANGSLVDGQTMPRIQLSPNTDDEFGRETVFHELAHVLVKLGTHHAVEFYEKLFDLVKRYGDRHGVDVEAVYRHERAYMRVATSVAAKHGVPEAQQAVATRRAVRANGNGCYAKSHNLMDRVAHQPRWHLALKPVEGIPHEHLGDVGWNSYAAYRVDRCGRCGWQGPVNRERLSYEVWDPTTGKKLKTLLKERKERESREA